MDEIVRAMNSTPRITATAGAIIAGGSSSRMKTGAKPLQRIGALTMLEHVILRAGRQVDRLVLNVNQDLQRYGEYELPLVPDVECVSGGPLVGIFSALQWYKSRERPPGFMFSFPADVPFFPPDLVAKLLAAVTEGGHQLAYASCGGQLQPLFACWSLDLLGPIAGEIDRGFTGPRYFFETCDSIAVEFLAGNPGEFFNVNEFKDLRIAQSLLEQNSLDRQL